MIAGPMSITPQWDHVKRRATYAIACPVHERWWLETTAEGADLIVEQHHRAKHRGIAREIGPT